MHGYAYAKKIVMGVGTISPCKVIADEQVGRYARGGDSALLSLSMVPILASGALLA